MSRRVPADRLDRAERLVFVKDGFSWLAACCPPLWLLANGLWLGRDRYPGATGLLGWSAQRWAIQI